LITEKNVFEEFRKMEYRRKGTCTGNVNHEIFQIFYRFIFTILAPTHVTVLLN
jgi:hypothetical protein